MLVQTFTCEHDGKEEVKTFTLTELVIAGWTGRDKAAVEHHIRELEALGVPRPTSTPVYYHVSISRLTQGRVVEMIGQASSGEAEFVLIQHDGELWVGLGSDHTDREAETHGITLSKQMCDKPIAPHLWRYADIADHWDQLQLSSEISNSSEDTLYQNGSVDLMLPVNEIIDQLGSGGKLPEGTVMFCGTLPAIGGIRPSKMFKMRLFDPVLEREISHEYRVRELAVAG